jgi:hypothetical protein
LNNVPLTFVEAINDNCYRIAISVEATRVGNQLLHLRLEGSPKDGWIFSDDFGNRGSQLRNAECELVSNCREQGFSISARSMASFEKEAATESPSILELVRESLHDGGFSRACGTIEPKDGGSWIHLQRPFAQVFEHFRSCFRMAFGLRIAFHRVVDSRQRYRVVQYVNSCNYYSVPRKISDDAVRHASFTMVLHIIHGKVSADPYVETQAGTHPMTSSTT